MMCIDTFRLIEIGLKAEMYCSLFVTWYFLPLVRKKRLSWQRIVVYCSKVFCSERFKFFKPLTAKKYTWLQKYCFPCVLFSSLLSEPRLKGSLMHIQNKWPRQSHRILSHVWNVIQAQLPVELRPCKSRHVVSSKQIIPGPFNPPKEKDISITAEHDMYFLCTWERVVA